MSIEKTFRRIVLVLFYVFCGILFVAVWRRIGWTQRAVDAMLILAVGRMLAAEVFRDPPRVVCSICGVNDGRRAVPICAECVRATNVIARERERAKILGGPETRS